MIAGLTERARVGLSKRRLLLQLYFLRGAYSGSGENIGSDIENDMAAALPAIMRAKTLFMAQILLLRLNMG